MPILIQDLTDLLRPNVGDQYWYIKRKHQGDWYYLKEFNDKKTKVIWTRNKEQAIPYSFEKSAQRVSEQIIREGVNIDLSEEILE